MTSPKDDKYLKSKTWYHGSVEPLEGALRALYLTPSPALAKMHGKALTAFKILPGASIVDLKDLDLQGSMDSIGYGDRIKKSGADVVWDKEDWLGYNQQIYVVNPDVLEPLDGVDEEFIGKKGGLSYFQMGGSLPDKFYNRKNGKPSRDPGVTGIKKESPYRTAGKLPPEDELRELEEALFDVMSKNLMKVVANWNLYQDYMEEETIRKLHDQLVNGRARVYRGEIVDTVKDLGLNWSEEDIDNVIIRWQDDGLFTKRFFSRKLKPTEKLWDRLDLEYKIREFFKKDRDDRRRYKSPSYKYKKSPVYDEPEY